MDPQTSGTVKADEPPPDATSFSYLESYIASKGSAQRMVNGQV